MTDTQRTPEHARRGFLRGTVQSAVAAAAALFFAFVVRAALRARHEPVSGGIEAVVGREGIVLEDLDPRGLVRVQRETWSAESAGGKIPRGRGVRVVRVVGGVRLIVEPAAAPADRELARHPVAGPEELQ